MDQGGRAEEPVGQHEGDLDAWDEALAKFHARFARFFYRREVRERSARDAVRDELIRFVAEQFGDADGIFVVDETVFVKKGATSLGVQRQYTGSVRKTEDCQVGVFLTYAGPQGDAFLDSARTCRKAGRTIRSVGRTRRVPRSRVDRHELTPQGDPRQPGAP